MFILETLQHALISEAENVVESEDSEDEWNYFRITNPKESLATAVTAATDEFSEDIEEQNKQDLESGSRGDSEIQSSKVEADIKCEGSEENIILGSISVDVNIICIIVFSWKNFYYSI